MDTRAKLGKRAFIILVGGEVVNRAVSEIDYIYEGFLRFLIDRQRKIQRSLTIPVINSENTLASNCTVISH